MQNITLTTKHYLSLAAIMLLAPIVPFSIRANELEVSDDELHFIQGYIRYGWYILSGIITAGVLSLVEQFIFDHPAITIASHSILIISIIMIFFGIFTIIHDTPIRNKDGHIQTHISINNNIFRYYLPVYNIYTRYTKPIDKETYRWKKESVLLWGLLILAIVIIPSPRTVFIGISIILWRAIGLFLGFDVIPLDIKQQLNKLFITHPEEIVSYIIWFILYKNKKTFIEEENIYGKGYSLSSIRAVCENVLLLGGYGRLVWDRYSAGKVVSRVLILPTIYIIWIYIIRIKMNKLSYIPGIDHIIRLFTFKKA